MLCGTRALPDLREVPVRTDDERRAVADVVIVNDGDLASLTEAVADLWSRLNAWL